MLGNGRPFVIEIIDAKRSAATEADVARLQKEINARAAPSAVHGGVPPEKYDGAVQVRELRLSTLASFDVLKAGAESKRKEYVALCWASRNISQAELDAKLGAVKDLAINQLTPIRVMHRRTVMNRPKTVHCMRAERLNRRWFLLYLTTSAGMYVKEFVHGDLGRTTPNVGSLLSSRTAGFVAGDHAPPPPPPPPSASSSSSSSSSCSSSSSSCGGGDGDGDGEGDGDGGDYCHCDILQLDVANVIM